MLNLRSRNGVHGREIERRVIDLGTTWRRTELCRAVLRELRGASGAAALALEERNMVGQ